MSQPSTASGTIQLICADLLFTSKISAAASHLHRKVHTCSDAAQVGGRGSADLVVIDLGTPGLDIAACVQQVRRSLGAVAIVAFGKHTAQQQLKAAVAAGCTEVMPRSAFFENIASILQGGAPAE